MSSPKTIYDAPALGGKAIAREQARELLGQVMGYVGLGLVLGLAVAPVIADYAKADPSALWQSAGATAELFGGSRE